MTYTIPPGTPKALKAAEFGRELAKAAAARSVSWNELERVTGIGHTSIDNYRNGRILPKTEVGQALATALQWPRLAELIVAARTFQCARRGCQRTFRNDTGAPRKFCSDECHRLNEKLKASARSNRSAGRAGVWSSADSAATRQLRAGLRIADERIVVLTDAIAAMCRGCEPEGACQTPECALRPHSPLPLAVHEVDDPRTRERIRAASYTRERSEKVSEAMRRRWAEPGRRERASETLTALFSDPERAERRNQRTREGIAARSPESMSQAARKAWATRRARAGAAS